jgi:hypothetical protein
VPELQPRPPVPVPVMKLALAWMRDEVGTGEVCKKLGTKHANVAIHRMAIAIRAAVREGLLK